MLNINTGNNRGLVRKIDSLGRVTLPKEYRESLNIEEGSKVEMFLLKEGIFIKKNEEVKNK